MRIVVLAALLGGCEPQPEGASWAVSLDASDASVSGVWGAAPDDVWAVGGDADGGRAWRWDGAAWGEVDLPEGTPMLVWSYGFSPDDVWMVGEDGAALRWDGATFTPLLTGTTSALWGVWGTSSDDLWMVGGDVGGPAPTLLHKEGAIVTSLTLDAAANPRQATALFKVWGTGGAVFAVGEAGLIVRLDGEAPAYSPTGPDADEDFVSLWGAGPDDIVAVGGRNSPRIARWDGSAWTTTKPDPSAVKPLNAVHVDGDTTIVGGLYGFVGAYDRATDAVTEETTATDIALHAVWGDGAGVTWGVGGTFVAPHRGAIVRREAE